MKAIAVLLLAALLVGLLYHIYKTDIPIEEMERIEQEAIEFARYCYENDYRPEECW